MSYSSRTSNDGKQAAPKDVQRVPRVSGPDTKFVVAFGIVQEDSKVVYAKPTAGASKSNNVRSMVRAYRFAQKRG